LQETNFFRGGRQKLYPGLGPKNPHGMGFECDDDRFDPALLRTPNQFAQHPQVRAMHSVEVPNAYQRRAKGGRDIFEVAKDLH
jgi:hypothetical protein